VKKLRVRSQVFVGSPAETWDAACKFGQEKLNEGYTTLLLVTSASKLAKRYGVPSGATMVRYWGKPAVDNRVRRC